MQKPAAPLRTSLALSVALAACAVNPATGRREISFVSESREIEMGREYDPQIVAQMGLYDDDALQAYVTALGEKLAAQSERPELPWTFRVVDDPAVNAFAVPGGFIYVTRGILAHLTTEAELAGVIGHEIGHVTARHSANQMTRMQLQQLGLGVGALLSDRVARMADYIGTGLGLINLRYSRGNESQSDELGVRYMARAGYDPGAMASVFETLALVSGDPSARTPEWASTHPYPENRGQRIHDLVAELPADQRPTAASDPQAFLTRLQGMVYGPDPRNGYFDGSLFLHPTMAFQLRFPEGWTTSNQPTRVAALNPAEDAVVMLELSSEADPESALETFLAQEGISAGPSRSDRVNGMAAARASFSVTSDEGDVEGTVTFIDHAGQVVQILGVGAAATWGRNEASIRTVAGTFARVRDRRVLDVQPNRIAIVRLPTSMTLDQFHERYPTPLGVEAIGRMNRVAPGETIPAGTFMKYVVRG